MKCKEALEQMSEYALGELDVEPRRALEKHLEECAACRTQSQRTARTVQAMAALPSIDTAESRRDRAAGAMAREHAQRVEGILLRPRRSRRLLWWGSVAAALLLAVGAGLLLLKPFEVDYTLRVVEVRGTAQVQRNGVWHPVQSGTELRRGDRLITDDQSVVVAELWGRKRVGELHINQNAALALGRNRTIDVERGEVYGQITEALTLRSVGNYVLMVRSGRFEAGLRLSESAVLSSRFSKPERTPEADLLFEGIPFEVVASEVGRIAGKTIVAGSDEVRGRKVWFYGVSTRGAQLAVDFETVLGGQGIGFRKDGDNWTAHFAIVAEKREVERRFFARLPAGEATLSAAGGTIRIAGGEEASVKRGTPEKSRLLTSDVPWLKPDFYAKVHRLTITLRVSGRDVELPAEGEEMFATVNGEPATITVGSAVRVGEGELHVPVKIRFERKR